MDNQTGFAQLGKKCIVNISDASGHVMAVYLSAYNQPQFHVEYKDSRGDRREEWFYEGQLTFVIDLVS